MDGEVEESVSAVKVERPVEVDDGLVAVLALQREPPRLVAGQDGVGDLRVDGVGLVGVVRGDAAEYRQTCNFGLAPTSERERKIYHQACKLKFRLRDLTSCLFSAASLAVCFKGRMAGVDATETGNQFSQLKFNLQACIIARFFGMQRHGEFQN